LIWKASKHENSYQIVRINIFFQLAKSVVAEDLTLKDREWICPECGIKHSRDKNVAVTIKTESKRLLIASQELLKKSMENYMGLDERLVSLVLTT
jgi:putative transposase